jgi:NAD(P)-dependent dehydrogenase (short-subunit alcohol dehydrogenase family)
MDRLTRDMAVEIKGHGVAVVGLWPSQVLTEFIVESAAKGDIAIDEEHAETPLYTGRVVAQLALDPDRLTRSGQIFTTAELAVHYGVHDERGKQPMGKRVPTLYRTPV